MSFLIPNPSANRVQASEEYILIKDINDDRFGLVSLVKSKSTSKYLFTKAKSEKNSSNRLMHEIQQRLNGLDANFLSVHDIQPDSNANVLKIYFEHFNSDLSQQIKLQKKEQKPFTEEELYALLLGPLAGLACLERNRMFHDCIAPMNIFRIDAHTYKIFDNYIFGEPKSLYHQVLQGHSSKYLAPELIEVLEESENISFEYDASKADVFSLGMCILDAGLLGIKGTFIHCQTRRFDEDLIEKAIQKFGEYYSSSLTNILRDMLCVNVMKRPNASLLLNNIQPTRGNLVKTSTTQGAVYKVLGRFTRVSPISRSTVTEFKTPTKDASHNPHSNTQPIYITQPYNVAGDAGLYKKSHGQTSFRSDFDDRTTNITYTPDRRDWRQSQSDGFFQGNMSLSSKANTTSHKTSIIVRGTHSENVPFANTFSTIKTQPFEGLSQVQSHRTSLRASVASNDSLEEFPSFFLSKDKLKIYHLKDIKGEGCSEADYQTKKTGPSTSEQKFKFGQKETALNRILRESVERSKTNVKLTLQEIQELPVNQSESDFL